MKNYTCFKELYFLHTFTNEKFYLVPSFEVKLTLFTLDVYFLGISPIIKSKSLFLSKTLLLKNVKLLLKI